jgi:nucleoside-diphosphate-sugar epimerase
MSILVTGCAGFIGSNVCQILLDRGESVEGLDNLNDTYDVRVKHWRLDRLKSRQGFRFYGTDLCDRTQLRTLFAGSGDGDNSPISSVINLGARAGLRQSTEDPWGFFEANTIGTLNLLELCREFEVKKLVLSSTSSVYGEDTPQPYREDSPASRPLSPYAASKKAAETLVYAYHHLYGLDATVLRYFTVYGPAGRPDMSIFIFIRRIAEGETITIFGDGKQDRDFTYVDDVARGTVAALKPLGYEIINLGGDRRTVLADVISMIEDLLGKKAILEYTPAHPADSRSSWADIERAGTLLDWRPEVSIEEGVRRTVEWYQENREWAKDLR